MIAGENVERFPDSGELPVHILQFRVRSPVRNVSGHNHEIGIIPVDLLDQLRHEFVIRVPRGEVQVGEHCDFQFRGSGNQRRDQQKNDQNISHERQSS